MTKKKVQLEKTVKAPASLVGFWDTAVGKSVKAAIYLAVSAAISGVITDITNNPVLFGQLTPIINIVLVLVRNVLKSDVKNI